MRYCLLADRIPAVTLENLTRRFNFDLFKRELGRSLALVSDGTRLILASGRKGGGRGAVVSKVTFESLFC